MRGMRAFSGMRLYLIGSGVLVLLYLVAQYYKPKPTNWNPSYLKEDKIPFGTYILYHQLEQLFPGTKVTPSRMPAYNVLKDKKDKNTAYLFIATKVTFNRLDFEELIKYMRRGNQVFIAAFELEDSFSKVLKLELSSAINFTKGKSMGINFVNPGLKSPQDYVFDKGLGDRYFSQVDSSRAIVLGKNADGQVNFVKYPFGKGGLYILSNPQLLSNYNLLNNKGAEYAGKVLSYLPQTTTALLWDENSTRGSMDNMSILRVIFEHAPLRWAYYLSMGGLLIFILFEIKRRQRIIPTIPPLRNTSVDFVEVVGRVYYQQRDNRDLAQKKISYFLEHIRTTYRLKTTNIDEEFISALTLKSGVNEAALRILFTNINELDHAYAVTDGQLIELNKSIEKFYKQAQ
ncbi:hypothetical protein D3C87_1269690 [compost metagenome]